MNAETSIALILQDSQPENPPAEAPGFGGMLVPILIVMGLFYIIMLGPERKQRKKREAMLAELKKGDKIMTTGGMYGTVAVVSDDVITVQISDGVRVRFNRSAIQGLTDGETSASAKKPDQGDKAGDAKKPQPAKA